MTRPPGFEPVEMSDVDAASDPTAMVSYLDEMAAAVRDRRLATYELLDLREGQRFLDVGCGAGEVLIDVAGLVGAAGRVSGVDLAETMVETTRTQLRAAGIDGEVQRADAHRLPFGDASFDRVRIERVLQHVENPVSVLAEIRRVLVPGGMVLAIDPNHDQADVATADVEAWRVLQKHGMKRVRHPRAGLHLREWLVAAGLADVCLKPSAFETPWPVFRTMTLLDNAAENAIAARELSAERFQKWLDEQDVRHAAGTFVGTFLGYRCLGTKL
jgi:SAM-dependent methyltransferase